MREYSDLAFEKHLGEGATFIVNLHRETATVETEAKLVAVKTAKLSEASYTSHGPGVDLHALLLEIQILQYEPLQNHPNIINVLGMDWTVTGNGVPTPRLIVEYAKFGTMSDYLRAHSVGIHEKIDLCLDIARGLQMVHKYGLVHGDMKLPNILVFEVDGGRVAKISDFGCALTSDEIEEGQRYRGTRSYHAPELKDDPALTIEDLRRCDVYAFGLCVWEILKNGLHYTENEATSALEATTLGAGKPLPDLFDTFLETVLGDVPPISIGRPHTLALDESESGKFNSVDGTQIALKSTFRNLVHYSIHPVPAKRHTIGVIVEILQRLVKPRNEEPQEITFPFRRSSAGVWGFAVHTTIPREAQREAVATLRASLTSADKEDKCRLLLMLSECYAHGYGVRTDFTEALSYLQQAAMAGSVSAEAVLLRISDAIRGGRADEPGPISNTSVDAFQVRQGFRDLESRLASLGNTQNFSARLRAWTRMGREEEEKAGFSFTDDEGHVFTVKPGTATNLARVLESNAIKHVETAVVTTKTEFGSGKALLLHGIASCGWTDLLRSLTKGTDLLLNTVPFLNDYGDLANPGNFLLAAACSGQAQVMKFLLASGVSASRWEGPISPPSWVNGLQFLFMLEDEEIEEVVQLLVEHGADPNMVGSYSLSLAPLAQDFPLELSGSPLDTAISVGDSRAVRALLRYGADPLQKSGPTQEKQEHTCLELAVALHTYEIVDVLLDHLLKGTPDPSQLLKLNGLLKHVCGLIMGGKGMFRRWLLHGSEYRLACDRTIETILKYGLSIDTKDEDGLTPLQVTAYASPCQHYVLEALLEHGADPNARNATGGVPLMQCCRTVWEPEDNARATQTLIKFGADVNVAEDDGQFILHYHASANSTASLRVILKAGASLECADSMGVTPLFSAAGAGGVEALKLLLNQGANIDRALIKEHPQKVTTPLGLAVLSGRTKAVRALLDDGASIVQKGTQGTVLNIATRFKQMEIVRVMLQEYSSIFCKRWVLNSMDSDSHTPLEAAALGGPSFIDLVLQAGADIDFRDPGQLESGTALATAVAYGRLDSAIYMLEKGASVFCRGAPHDQMWSFLNELVYFCGESHDLRPKFAGFLLSSQKWIDQHRLLSVRNWAGQTILQSAVHHGQFAAVKALVEFGAELEDQLHVVRLPYWNKTNHFWDVYKVKGLDIVSFARLLRNSTPKQKAVWAQFIPFEITTEDMDAIIQYLSEVRGHAPAPAQTLTHHHPKSTLSRYFSRRKYGVRFQWSGSVG